MVSEHDLGGQFERLKAQNLERLKELAIMNRTSHIIRENRPPEETLKHIAMILPDGWQYPASTGARIMYDGHFYLSPNFNLTEWKQIQEFSTIDDKKGFIEISYAKEFPTADEGPFLAEERDLIFNLSNMICGYINSYKGLRIIEKISPKDKNRKQEEPVKEALPGRKLLQLFLNKNNADRDIYHDLMTFKVKEIMLISNLYDAYSIEREGRFSEHVLGHYHQLNLTSVPRITGVTTASEAFEMLQSKYYDLIIFMVSVDKKTPVELSRKIKKDFPNLPIFFLLNSNADIAYFSKVSRETLSIDRLYTWNGDSSVFFSMIKMVEDRINVVNDTRIGLVRVILLVEDSPIYYSRYLPMLYKIVMEQTRRIIDDVSTDELYKVLRMRARPKILLASNYEEACKILMKYKEYMLCLITDIRFDRDDIKDDQAGIDLVEFAKNLIPDLPVIIQSSDTENVKIAYRYKSTFIDKNSETLSQDFQSFITHFLGFGNFVYRDQYGNPITQARTLKEFEQKLRTIPDESLIYHAQRNHFSLWLMARGEIRVAKILNPKKVADYDNPSELRNELLQMIQRFRNEQDTGKIVPYDEDALNNEKNIVSLAEGSLGGKGRGLAFINSLIHNYDFSQHVPDITIRTPKTSLIGTEEFSLFMERNNLHDYVLGETDYEKIKRTFIQGKLTPTLIRRLRTLLKIIRKPLAVRSSGLFEDSLAQPFAGIFETYILPNSHQDLEFRLQQLTDAIKLVFASVFSDIARGYVNAINYSIDQEKMAVVIQELVGKQFESYYYPHVSGVAQSYNYYPFGHMKPEEGFAIAAIGLGKYVVEGDKAYRFSPRYPTLDINSSKDQVKNSQVNFLAVDLECTDPKLLEGDMAGLVTLDLSDAEQHGSLRHCASVFNFDNNTIYPGLSKQGTRIVNFANILKYNYTPLAQTLEIVLDVVKEALGTAVEIEWALDLDRDEKGNCSFYLLQIKPLLGSADDYVVNMDEIKQEDILLHSVKGMGNGVIRDIKDVIYVDRLAFDKRYTEEMAREISQLNEQMVAQQRPYILIGPGRWGTRDRWIGIPVNWPQISQAKVIVETSLEDFPLDASSGSHFFHNVTSMNVGYFTIQPELSKSYVNYDMLNEQRIIRQTRFFKHVRFEDYLTVRMDGKKRISVITIKS
ncbi:MAG: pyruvate phosphate dikinase PEP/pyruvate-binding protein [Bacteroidetes bacterium]|nr:MAG: pyruvate phosphate dikinase PEP/pyruvate-binding protein [Bacteroidota bacterium]